VAGAVFRVFVVGAVSHACKTEQNSREIFFSPLLKRWRNKSAYDPNFALFFAISTLVFCSLCLLFFVFFLFYFFVGGIIS